MPVLLSFYGKTAWICRNNLARYLFCFINVQYSSFEPNRTFNGAQISIITTSTEGTISQFLNCRLNS